MRTIALSRDARGTAFVEGTVRDILYALRTFKRAPLVAVAASWPDAPRAAFAETSRAKTAIADKFVSPESSMLKTGVAD